MMPSTVATSRLAPETCRLLAFRACLVLGACVLAPGNVTPGTAHRASTTLPDGGAIPPLAGTLEGPGGFRLGTAAAPIGGATAVADFDGDGTPDVAIADRLGRTARGYDYALEVVFARPARQRITFASQHGALTIGVRDVDHDSDQDLVVSALLTQEVVAVWLNDGVGRFDEADPQDFPAALPPLVVMTAARVAALAGAALEPKRAGDIGRVTGVLVRVSVSPVILPPVRAPWFTSSCRLALRGPPTPLS